MNQLTLINKKDGLYNFKFKTVGICAREIYILVDEKKTIHDTKFIGGCDGNLKAVPKLICGEKLEYVVSRLSDITCGNKSTSCTNQLATACQLILDTTFNN